MTALEIIAGSAWFLVYALGAYAAVRIFSHQSPAFLAVVVACLSTIASLPVSALTSVEGNYWRILAVFSFLTLCHLMAFGAAYKSISLRILLDLYRAPSRKLPIEEIFSRYIERESFEARIEVMIAQGLAADAGGGMFLTPKGYRLANAVRLLQRLYGIEKSG